MRRQLATLVAAALLLFLAIGAAPARQDDAAAILSRDLQALGGDGAVKAVSAYRALGVVQAGDTTGTFALYAQRPDRFRVEINLPPTRRTLIASELGTWLRDAAGRHELTEEDAAWLRICAFVASFSYLEATAYQSSQADTEAHALTTSAPGAPTTFLFDAGSGLLTRVSGANGSLGLSDYRVEAGVMFPHQIDVARGDEKLVLKVLETDVNPSLPEELFQAPLRPLGMRTLPGGKQAVTVPFEFSRNLVFVHAKLGEHPLTLILDSGAGSTVLNQRLVTELGLKTAGQVRGMGAGGAVQGSIVRLEGLALGEAQLAPAIVPTLDLTDIEKLAAHRIDGILGYTFIADGAIQIDYEKRELTLFAPEVYLPPPEAMALDVTFRHNLPHVRGALNDLSEAWLTLDTGNSGALVIMADYARAHGIGTEIPPRAKTVAAGVGGTVESALVRLRSLRLGSVTLESVVGVLGPALKLPLGGGDIAGVLGAVIFQRFTLTLDYPNNKVYLVPNQRLHEPFHYNRTGLAARPEPGGSRVFFVAPDSPAAKAGLKEGDLVLSINGIAATPENVDLLRPLGEGTPGTVLTLEVERQGNRLEIQMILEELV